MQGQTAGIMQKKKKNPERIEIEFFVGTIVRTAGEQLIRRIFHHVIEIFYYFVVNKIVGISNIIDIGKQNIEIEKESNRSLI